LDSPNKPLVGQMRVAAYATVAAVVAIILAPLFFLTPVRVGDGSEYYALYLAVKSELRPWMTAVAFERYASLVATHSIEGLVNVEFLRDAFPALRVGNTADFNHFWIYSLISAMLARVVGIVGVQLSAHQAFLLQHVMLLMLVACLALRLFGRRGVWAVMLLTLGSPLVWFADKVHTEFFSYCVVLAAVMLALRRHFTWGALLLALASTQNPSFAVLAFVLLVCRLFQVPRHPFQFWEACALVATCITVLLHPAYYFFRYGVLTPQMLAGGAKMGANASSFYIWLADPDVGLLPNWPIGIGLVVWGITRQIRHKAGTWNGPFALFLLLYLVINLFAQSSTTNINSGATPGLSRYALWYIPLFFPLALDVVDWALERRTLGRGTLVTLLILYVVGNIAVYDPRQYESYVQPAPLSKLMQSQWPALYDPPPEVFAERYSGFGESEKTHRLSAILGPSCDKVLIIPGRDPSEIAKPNHCRMDDEKLAAYVSELLSTPGGERYVRVKGLRAEIGLKAGPSYEPRAGQPGRRLLGAGWYEPESWGVWSASKSAEVFVPCPTTTDSTNAFKVGLSISAFGGKPQEPALAKVRANGTVVWSGKITEAPVTAEFVLGRNTCGPDSIATLTLETGTLRSPKEVSGSEDTRKLGLGLLRIFYP